VLRAGFRHVTDDRKGATVRAMRLRRHRAGGADASAPRRRQPPQLPAGSYVTDEERLFRVVRALGTGAGPGRLFELEDCRTLELVLCPATALARVRLRRVVPALGA
jgi:hypothetical protein